MLMTLEAFFEKSVGEVWQVDFGPASFYPALSAAFSVSGRDIMVDRSKSDEGFCLEKRDGHCHAAMG